MLRFVTLHQSFITNLFDRQRSCNKALKVHACVLLVYSCSLLKLGQKNATNRILLGKSLMHTTKYIIKTTKLI